MKSMRVVMRVQISSSFCKRVWLLEDDDARSEEIVSFGSLTVWVLFVWSLKTPNTFCLIVTNTGTKSTFRWYRWEAFVVLPRWTYCCTTVKTTFILRYYVLRLFFFPLFRLCQLPWTAKLYITTIMHKKISRSKFAINCCKDWFKSI